MCVHFAGERARFTQFWINFQSSLRFTEKRDGMCKDFPLALCCSSERLVFREATCTDTSLSRHTSSSHQDSVFPWTRGMTCVGVLEVFLTFPMHPSLLIFFIACVFSRISQNWNHLVDNQCWAIHHCLEMPQFIYPFSS